jgi:hypothetical protein
MTPTRTVTIIQGIGIIAAGCLPIIAWIALEVYRG